MYLPQELPNARVLITVKTYPLPSRTYGGLVCTAGLLPDGKWIRIYPVQFRELAYSKQYKKYNWIELDLIRNFKDFRPESYRPKRGDQEDIKIGPEISTADNWLWRKDYVFKEVFESMNELIAHARGQEKKSLGTLKPLEILDFEIKEDERDWKPKWRQQLQQLNLFQLDDTGQGKERRIIRKLPYKYSYKFLSVGDVRPRTLMIEDWEIGALYWNCLAKTEGDEVEANKLVRKKYFDEFVNTKDLHLFLGTTYQYHARNMTNPFVIIGVFAPPKVIAEQPRLFSI